MEPLMFHTSQALFHTRKIITSKRNTPSFFGQRKNEIHRDNEQVETDDTEIYICANRISLKDHHLRLGLAVAAGSSLGLLGEVELTAQVLKL